jgi:hypothetical protein
MSPPKVERLPPEEKILSWVEARTTTLTVSSSRASSSASISSPSSSLESELRVSGSSSAIVAIPLSAAS